MYIIEDHQNDSRQTTFTYHESVATNNICLSYFPISVKFLTQLLAGSSNSYVTNEYLCGRPAWTT